MAPLPEQLRNLAETRCREIGARLTPARLLAYSELVAHGRPTTAYELMHLLETCQKRRVAPQTVYRHLDFLTNVGLVHRIESTQSYTPCDHPAHEHPCQYLLCSACGQVDELQEEPVAALLDRLADQRGFRVESAVVEIKGVCEDCRK